MKRTILTAAVLAAALLAGCGGDSDDEQGICIDPATQQRVDDDACDSDGHTWVLVPHPPAVGQKASGYRAAPAGTRPSVRSRPNTVRRQPAQLSPARRR